MPKYVIEREIPGIGSVTTKAMQRIAQKSNGILNELGPQIQWVHSYVTGDKMYCVYIAPDAEMVFEHARRGDFPANSVLQVQRLVEPTSANN